MGSEKPDFRSERPDLGFERPDFGPERHDFRFGRPGLKLRGGGMKTRWKPEKSPYVESMVIGPSRAAAQNGNDHPTN